MKTYKYLLLPLLLLLSFLPVKADYLNELLKLSRFETLAQYNENSIVKQISSYDTTGGNDDGFSGKYSFIRKEDGNLVIADLKGSGVIQRIWTPTPTNDTLQFFFDGESTPRLSLRFIDLFNGTVYPFVRPVVGNEVGGYYCYIPLIYKESCKIVFKGSVMQFIQIQYLEYPKGSVRNSYPVQFSNSEKEALQTAVDCWSLTGWEAMKIAGVFNRQQVQQKNSSLLLKPGTTTALFEQQGAGRIIGVELIPQAGLNQEFKDLILQAQWDDDPVPAINCPVSDFFGYAYGKPTMKSMLLGVNEGNHYCFLPMPFAKKSKLQIEYLQHPGNENRDLPILVKIYYSDDGKAKNEGRFYAKWKREINPEIGKPYEILDVTGCGHYVGTLLQAQGLNSGMTIFFEGDDVCTIDGEMRLHGTGSEDFFNGGWYAIPDRWEQAFNLPVHGCLAYSIPLARTGAYRLYPADKLAFEKSLNMTIEHGPEGNNIPVDYTSVAMYYCDQAPETNDLQDHELLKAIQPPILQEYWIQLLPIRALSSGSTMIRDVKKDEKKNVQEGVMRLEGTPGRYAKFELEVPGNGMYRLFLSYFKGPDCSAFAINQRQIPISQTIEGHAPEYQFVEKEYIGELNIQEGTNTITVVLKSNPEGLEKGSFCLQRIFLERE